MCSSFFPWGIINQFVTLHFSCLLGSWWAKRTKVRGSKLSLGLKTSMSLYNSINKINEHVCLCELKQGLPGWVVSLFCNAGCGQRNEAISLFCWLPWLSSWSHTKPPVICFPGAGSRTEQRASNEPEMSTPHFISNCASKSLRQSACGWNEQEISGFMDHLLSPHQT